MKLQQFKVKLIFRAGVWTPTGRLYPKKVIDRCISQAMIRMGRRELIGHLNSPHAEVSHVVTWLFRKGKNVVAQVELLDTPVGQELSYFMTDFPQVKLVGVPFCSGKEEKAPGDKRVITFLEFEYIDLELADYADNQENGLYHILKVRARDRARSQTGE